MWQNLYCLSKKKKKKNVAKFPILHTEQNKQMWRKKSNNEFQSYHWKLPQF